MERKNGQEKPGDICRKLFNFLKNRFISVIQGRTNATISTKTSPSAWEDRESQVLVPVSKKNAEVTVEHRATVPKASSESHEETITSTVQDGGTTSVKPRKRSITIWGGTEEKDVKDVSSREASVGEQGKAGETEAAKDGGMEKKPSTDINVRSGEFIKRQKGSFANDVGMQKKPPPNSSSLS